MITSYPTRTLADIASRIDYGFTASSATEAIGPKFLRITDIVQDHIDWESVPYCAIDNAKQSKYRLAFGDIVIARTGATVGFAKLIRRAPDAVFASYLVRVRISAEHDPTYVGYVVESSDYKDFVRSVAGGAAQPNANAKVLTSYPVPTPPLAVQRKIAAILCAYDDLIANNTRRMKILEEMAQRIYREWFVDFRYPGHDEVPRLDSPLGPIPQNWQVVELGEVLSLEYGRALREDDRVPGNVLVLGSSGPVGWHDQALVTGPGVVVGRKGNVGSVYWVDQDFFPIDTVFYAKTSWPLLFVFYMLRNHTWVTGDTAVPGLSRQRAYLDQIVLAPRGLAESFAAAIADLRREVGTLSRASANLRATRDLLLPRLLSGEIDVENLVIALGDAAA